MENGQILETIFGIFKERNVDFFTFEIRSFAIKMYIWHKLRKIFQVSNLGTAIFFILNIVLIYSVFGKSGESIYLIALYFIIITISLSPIGEWFLCVVVGAEDIKRIDTKIHVIPLIEVVLDAAKEKSSCCVKRVNVKIIRDQTPNAFAIGKHTLVLTEGLLKLPDDLVMSIIAHEIGHLVYGHTVIQLLIGGGNLFISGFLLLIKVICWFMTAIMGIFSVVAKSRIMGIITVVLAGISYFSTWAWVKFCKLFLMWSMRENEYVADKYAAKIGFGYELAYALDHEICDVPYNGFLRALYNTHPCNDARIAALQNYGVNYSYYKI